MPLKKAFRLREAEEKFIVNAKIGQGILVTPECRLPFYNMLSDEERRLFTTRAHMAPLCGVPQSKSEKTVRLSLIVDPSFTSSAFFRPSAKVLPEAVNS